MSEKNLYVRIGVIVLLIALSIWEMSPPSEKLKGGIDLRGGTKLVYEIDVSGLRPEQKQDIVDRTMRRLQQRVDPKGQRNLIWRPLGGYRLEIQMPRPPEELAARRRAYEAARQKLRDTQIDRYEIESMLNLSGEAREAALRGLVRDVPAREKMLRDLVAAKDTLDAARGATTHPAGVNLDDVRRAYNKGFDDLLATNINIEKLADILEQTSGKEREDALNKMRAERPARVDLINKMVSAYDDWAKTKGPLEDASDLIRLLRGQGKLEFRILAEPDPQNPTLILSPNNPRAHDPIQTYTDDLAKYGPRRRAGHNYQWFKVAKPEEFKPSGTPILADYLGAQYVLCHDDEGMALKSDGTWKLEQAAPRRDQRSRWAVSFYLDVIGGRKFYDLTDANKERPLCILLDDQAMSAPNIKSAIDREGEITGDFTLEEVNNLCNILEAGSLDARLKDTPISVQTVGPSLGERNRQRGLQACLTALICVVAFMAIYYLYGGFVADIALMLNLLITLGIMAMIQGTFTLQGIAGLILTLGMAVDANVLIFERIREEQARGVSLKMAVKLGYDRAFWVIFDSNLTTIITAVILGYIGSEEIKGFALTLGIGLCVSLFTALFVTRQFFTVMVQTRVNSMEARRCWGGAAIIAVAAGLLFGVGALFNSRAHWADSTAIGAAKFLGICAGSGLVLLALIWGMRYVTIYSGSLRRNHLPMLSLLKPTKIDWMAKQPVFWVVSGVLTLGGLLLFSLQPRETLLDIEFLGGTSAQVSLTPTTPDHKIVDAEIEKIVTGPQGRGHAAGWLNWAADSLEKAHVGAGADGRFEVIDQTLTSNQLRALLLGSVRDLIVKDGIDRIPDGVAVTLQPKIVAEATSSTPAQEAPYTLEEFRQLVADAVAAARRGAKNLETTARVQAVETTGAAALEENPPQTFLVVTTETNREMVGEALLGALSEHKDFTVRVERPVDFTLVKNPTLAPDGAYPIRADAVQLTDVIGQPAPFDVQTLKGGVAFVLDQVEPPQTTQSIDERIRNMRLQPDFEQLGWRESTIFGLTPTGQTVKDAEGKEVPTYTKMAVCVADDNFAYFDNEEAWKSQLATPEMNLLTTALSAERSLDQLTSFAPQVAQQAMNQAIAALLLSFFAMIAYLWFRFGTMEFGLGAIIALIHDVAVALGLVTATHWISGTAVGHMLGITTMRIDLAMVAAFLTIVGYSVNDTIVVFDRIRENRGRLATVSPQLINAAINQTLPRSILTSFTTILVVIVLYVLGGPGVHAFAFAMIIGVATGTYSSIAIASPILYRPAVMRVMLGVIVAVLSLGMVVGSESHAVRVFMTIVGLATLGLLGYWHYRRREAEARLRMAM